MRRNIKHLKELRDITTRRLEKRQIEAAKFGDQADPHVLIEIEDLEQELQQIDAEIAEAEQTSTIPMLLQHNTASTIPRWALYAVIAAGLALTGIVVMNAFPQLSTTGNEGRTDTVIPTATFFPAATIQQPQATIAPTAAIPTVTIPPTREVVPSAALPDATPTIEEQYWVEATPTLTLPQVLLIMNATGPCFSTNDLEPLTGQLTDAYPDGRTLQIKTISPADTISTGLDPSERLLIEANCAIQASPTITVTLLGLPAVDVPLLFEPQQVTITTDPVRAKILIRGLIFYSMGAYEAAQGTLEQVSGSFTTNDSSGNFSWLWGNLQLRNERWSQAFDTYTAAIRQRAVIAPELTPAPLFSNRALVGLHWHSAETNLSEKCSRNARNDIDVAIRADRPDELDPILPITRSDRSSFYVLKGQILLACPRDDSDANDNNLDLSKHAAEQVGEARLLASANAQVYSLEAMVGLENPGAEIGAPLIVEQNACKALEIDPTLPEPQRTLAILYARNGLPELARERYQAYALSARFTWQRQRALESWRNAIRQNEEPSPGLGTCNH